MQSWFRLPKTVMLSHTNPSQSVVANHRVVLENSPCPDSPFCHYMVFLENSSSSRNFQTRHSFVDETRIVREYLQSSRPPHYAP